MSGLIGRKPGGKAITIETQSIDPNGTKDGVLKKSKVKVAHIKSSFVVGVRIGAKQEIILKLNTYEVHKNPDPTTAKELTRLFPVMKDEKWLGFAVAADDLPDPSQFDTHFELKPFPQKGQFQLVPFVIALTSGDFAAGMYSIAASVVTSPVDGPVELTGRS